MQQEFQIQISPEIAQDNEQLKKYIAKKEQLDFEQIKHVEILKRSIDARQRNVKINLRVNVFIKEVFTEPEIEIPHYNDVSKSKEVIVIGAGPAGAVASA